MMPTCPGLCCENLIITGESAFERLTRPGIDLLGHDALLDMLDPRVLAGSSFDESLPCRRWDPQTRLCMQYEDRPQTCTDYPSYGRQTACGHCTYETIPGPGIAWQEWATRFLRGDPEVTEAAKAAYEKIRTALTHGVVNLEKADQKEVLDSLESDIFGMQDDLI